MFQKRSLSTGFLVASLGIAASLAVVSSPNVASADAGCASIKNSTVKAFCDSKGKDKLKKAMKEAMEAANDAGGEKLECKSCHTDQKEYKLASGGEDKFKARMEKHFGK